MSAAKHTPEPWFAPGGMILDSRPKYDAHGARIGNTPNMIAEIEYPYSDDQGQTANAERIVACVNFCAGLTNEQLAATDGAIHGYEKFQALAVQRDELLAALKAINAALTQNATFPADVELARDVARNAIAKVRS